MGQAPSKSVEDKARIVLAVLRGEISIAAAARREGTSAVSISKWRDVFLAGGLGGMGAPQAGRTEAGRRRRHRSGGVSDSTMYRILPRNGRCLPANYAAEVR